MKNINIWGLTIVVFCISWIGVLPSLMIAYGMEIPAGFKKVDILMTLGPLIGALLFIGKVQGKEGLKSFFKKLLRFRATPVVIAITILLPIGVSLLGSVIGFNSIK